jgi:hypothetical protein
MAKGHTISRTVMYQMKAETACIDIKDVEAQRLSQEGPERPTASKAPLNKLDCLMNWSNNFLSGQSSDRIYPVSEASRSTWGTWPPTER